MCISGQDENILLCVQETENYKKKKKKENYGEELQWNIRKIFQMQL